LKSIKGEQTRLKLLEEARVFFNREGIWMTLEKVAQGIGVNKSLISNHFSTKERLFIAIFQQYELELGAFVMSQMEVRGQDPFAALFQLLRGVMDIQFKYRCGMQYLNQLHATQAEMREQIDVNYTRNRANIRLRLEKMVEEGLVQPVVLESQNWSAFLFVYVNILTHWVAHREVYDSETDLDIVKTNYLRGFFYHTFGPYLTPKGWKSVHALPL
jgi:AcrR family transcriptional regulator